MNYTVKEGYNYNKHQIKSIVHMLYLDYKLGHGRSETSYVKEWFAHNVLYKLGLFRSHTADVDLNDNESCFRRLCYNIIYYVCLGWKTHKKRN